MMLPKPCKKAPAVKKVPAASPPNPKICKCGPSNAGKATTKPTAKKAKKANDEPAEDDNNNARNVGGTAKAVKMTRAKKPRCFLLFFFLGLPLMI
jgi:hypothetical protein